MVDILRFFHDHGFVHVDDGHDFSRFGTVIGAGAVKYPTAMEANFAGAEGFNDVWEIGDAKLFLDFNFAVVADFEVSTGDDLVTSGAEF